MTIKILLCLNIASFRGYIFYVILHKYFFDKKLAKPK